VVQYRGGKNTRLEVRADAPAGMDYVFIGETLPFDSVRGDLLITDDRVQLIGMEAALFGGTVRGGADISLGEDRRYSANVAVDGINFPTLTKLYFDYDTARGELSGTYDFEGQTGDTRTMRGAGKIKVANGSVFAIPVFGPLSALIAAVIPGAGYSVAKQATASFTIKDGVIKTDDFNVSGKLFGMVGNGDLHFLDNKLDFDMRIDAKGAGVVLTPSTSFSNTKARGAFRNRRGARSASDPRADLCPLMQRDAAADPRLVLVELHAHHRALAHPDEVVHEHRLATFRPDKHHPDLGL
jgi:hypothetical protein